MNETIEINETNEAGVAAPESGVMVTVDGAMLLAGAPENLFQQPARSAEGGEQVALAFVV